jgi:hypothetical protein
MFLPRLHQPLMGKGFGIPGIALGDGMPYLLCFGILSACFQGESIRWARLRECHCVHSRSQSHQQRQALNSNQAAHHTPPRDQHELKVHVVFNHSQIPVLNSMSCLQKKVQGRWFLPWTAL